MRNERELKYTNEWLEIENEILEEADRDSALESEGLRSGSAGCLGGRGAVRGQAALERRGG